MEETFNKLKNENKNNVDNLIKWMQNCTRRKNLMETNGGMEKYFQNFAKLVSQEKKAEDEARKLFEGIQDNGNVDLSKFKEVIGKLAEKQQKSTEEFTNSLAAEGAKFYDAAMSAVSAAASAASSALAGAFANK